MKKHVISLITLFSVGFMWFNPQPADAAASVQVQIPSYPIIINGVPVDSVKEAYPLLSYRDITYFPMTWDYGQVLGLETKWDQQAGLSIQKNVSDSVKLGLSGNADNSDKASYKASVVDFPVSVNGETINNANEPYPLLQFRDITYFPMTWRFAVEEFNWGLDWNDQRGLSILSPQRKLLQEIVFDDADYLYFQSTLSEYYKINKALSGIPEKLSDAESAVIVEKISLRQTNRHFPEQIQDANIQQKDNAIYWNDLEVMSLVSYIKSNDEYYQDHLDLENKGIDANVVSIPLNDKLVLIQVTISTLRHIPGPYAPHASFLHLVNQAAHTSVPITAYDQRISLRLENSDGSFWIASGNAPDYINTRNSDRRAQLLLIHKDGQIESMNNTLQAKDIDIVHIADDGSLIVNVYDHRYSEIGHGAKDGIYHLSKDGKAEKWFDYVSTQVYVDENLNVMAVEEESNTIRNLTANSFAFWYDYEIYEVP